MRSPSDLKAGFSMPGNHIRVFFIFLFLSLCYSEVSAQAWLWNYSRSQTFGIVKFDLYKKPAIASTMGLQYYGANVSLLTSFNLHITGEFHVTTVCGTDIMTIFDIRPTALIANNVDVLDTGQMPKSFMVGSGQLLKGIDNSQCAGNPVVIGGFKTVAVIQDISIRNVKLAKIRDDGTEVPINYDGTLVNPPTGPTSSTGTNGTTGSTLVQSQNQQNITASKAQTVQQQKQAKWDSLQALNQNNQAEVKQDVSQLSNLIVQAAQDGNMVGVYVGLGVPTVGLLVAVLVNTSNLSGVAGGAAYVLGGATAVYLLMRGDHFNKHWFAMKSQLGLGFEQMPALANSSVHSNTLSATPQYPYGYFGLKMTFFNNRGTSFSLLPYFSHSINGIDKSTDANEYMYGVNGTLLLGKTNTSAGRFFLEGGWYQRYLNYTDNSAFEAGNFNYSVLRYGGGIMLWTLNKKGTRESYIKPGVFFEVPSFAKSGQPPVMVGNVQLMISNAVMLEGSYSHNYLIGGDISYPHSISAPSKDFFSIKLIKTSNLF
jgi:hypothetical protein